MPMDGSAVISQFICDVDSDKIIPKGFDPWARVGSVEELSIRIIDAVAIDGLVINYKPILKIWISKKGVNNVSDCVPLEALQADA